MRFYIPHYVIQQACRRRGGTARPDIDARYQVSLNVQVLGKSYLHKVHGQVEKIIL